MNRLVIDRHDQTHKVTIRSVDIETCDICGQVGKAIMVSTPPPTVRPGADHAIDCYCPNCFVDQVL